jgi:hypothetical protein
MGRGGSILGFWMMMLLVGEEHKGLFVYGRFELVSQDDKLMIFTKEGRELGVCEPYRQEDEVDYAEGGGRFGNETVY